MKNYKILLLIIIFQLSNQMAISQTKQDTINIIRESLFWSKYAYSLFPFNPEIREYVTIVDKYMNTPRIDTIYLDSKNFLQGDAPKIELEPKPIFSNSWLKFVILDAEEYASKLPKPKGNDSKNFSCYNLNAIEITNDSALVNYSYYTYLIRKDEIIPFGDDVCCNILLIRKNGYWVFRRFY